MTVTEAIGLSAAALAGYAYVPQISHLVRERCSAGVSEKAFALWLGASVLMTIHAVSIGSGVFVVLGLQQVACTGVVAFFCRRYRGHTCPSHDTAPTSSGPPSPIAAQGGRGSGGCWRAPNASERSVPSPLASNSQASGSDVVGAATSPPVGA
jgi:uncharacterized protein with PQ loop repeat